jgi:hypothetical protein
MVLNDTVYNLGVAINRTGGKSAYGSLEATYVPDNGEPILVGIANGVGVYTELSRRLYNLPLRISKGVNLRGGKLVVRYLTPRDSGGKELASAEYRIP